MSKSTAAISESRRQIVHRTRGLRHGAITRLMSPSDRGHILKPFVFLDLFDSEGTSFSAMALHPHSGIATLTYMIEGSVRYEDTSGATGTLPEGGVEWFKAGHGAWHGGGPNGSGRARGFQLWIPFLPNMNSARSKASTRHRKPFRETDPQLYCSANMAASQASFRRPRQ